MTSNPRREWKSFLWVAKWSVRLRMRSLKTATWTSGDPVSRSLVAYSVMSACLRSAVIDTDLSPSTINDSRRSKSAVFDSGQSDHRLVVPSAYDRTLIKPLKPRPYATIVRRHPLPVAHSSSFARSQRQRRDVVQRGLDGQQVPRCLQTMAMLKYRIQRIRLYFAKGADRQATQLSNMPERPERRTEIAGEGAHICPLADDGLAIGVVAIRHGDQPQRNHLNLTRLERRRCCSPREHICAPSADLDGRIRRRRLQDRPGKVGQSLLDFGSRGPRRTFARNHAFAIVSGACNTPSDAEAIVLTAVHRVR